MTACALQLPPSMHVLERGWLSANNVLFFGRDEVAMVDTGYVTHSEQTLTLVQHVLHQRQRPGLDLLLNTHLHSDHCGGNAALQERYACRTLIPAGEADAVRRWDEAALSYLATGQQCPRFGFDGVIGHGERLRLGELDWQTLAAPGHDPHSVMLYCASEGILISADALWRHGFGIVFPELDGETGFDEVRATLELIGTLDIRLVIPGHGAPFDDIGPALSRAFSRLDYLQADPLRNAQNGIKVLLKFLLLERQRIAQDDLPAMMRDIPLLRIANARFMQMSDAALATWATAQLERAGAARCADGYLLDA
jgi:glyoxylase-like metal-dependent hydrolase (beta-lactamase superfamily II)